MPIEKMHYVSVVVQLFLIFVILLELRLIVNDYWK